MKKFLTFFLTALLTFSVGWAATVTDVLTLDGLGLSGIGQTYTNFSNKTFSSTAVYAGKCAGSYSSIQLRSKSSDSGIITTASGGKLKSITLVWNSATSNSRTVFVYGKNTPYSAVSELYSTSTR